MTCDRVALTCEAVQFTGRPGPVEDFIRTSLMPQFGRYALVSPDGAIWTFLEPGDWVVRGVGKDWDYYVIKAEKFRKLWRPRTTV